MALVPAKCTQCGGQIEVDDTKEAGICKHCGTAFITEKAINNYTTVHNITNNITKIINGKESDDGDIHFNRGLTNLKIKKYDAARKNFDKAIRANPEIGKYYLYWCIAQSRNFEYYGSFFDENDDEYDEELKEYSHNFKPFFELAPEQERKQLSQEYGLDLSTWDTAKYSLFEKYLKESDNLNAIDYVEVVNMFSADELNSLKQKINNWVNRIIKKLKTEPYKYSSTKLFDIIKYNIDKNIYPLSEQIKKYQIEQGVEIIDSKIFYNFAINYEIEDSDKAMAELSGELKTESDFVCAQMKEKKNKEQIDKVNALCSVAYMVVLGIAFVVFVVSYFKIYHDLFQTGEATLGAPIKPSLNISLAVLGIGIVLVAIYHKIALIKFKK